MRTANLSDRLVLVAGEHALDVERASAGRFAADPAAVFDRWAEFVEWAGTVDVESHADAVAFAPADLKAPSPRPRQIIAVGLNYADHARESGLAIPSHPVVFTKFASAVTGPDADVRLPGDTVDWEVELVVVIGAGGRSIPVDEARERIAGYTVGQDLSERTVQWRGEPAQFSMGKSFEGFAPTGPVVVTLDEFDDPDRLSLTTTIVSADGTESRVQDGSTAELIFPIADLISRLSHTVELLPGDLVFTGTPPGVGAGMKPPRFLVDGDTLITEIGGIGRITQRFHA
ncbi:fumarylacetoacetate hydrolase family protein [Microbacterium rhizomatis]|uniref:Fumarylacetoacetate hydrolase family protein n=1 Tax=Microbacterium rhizomatis TaxID=1631477 RepID=A0A5J5IYB1_9MICO|nr:fumarylacetoacetate hydrolase family protein [Microbacterium rhizomatis]KAA9105052.1 fumarylacetoacetate hydrolase family protein [Microbacterium rhizomatis]